MQEICKNCKWLELPCYDRPERFCNCFFIWVSEADFCAYFEKKEEKNEKSI